MGHPKFMREPTSLETWATWPFDAPDPSLRPDQDDSREDERPDAEKLSLSI